MSESRGIVHVGSPPANYSPLEDMKFIEFHNFENLSRETGVATKSPEFECAGYRWKLIIYPGGKDISYDGYVGVYLQSMGPDEFECEYSIGLKQIKLIGNLLEGLETLHADEKIFTPSDPEDGHRNCFQLSKVMEHPEDYLLEGTLTFFVSIRSTPEFYHGTVKQQCGMIKKLQKAFLNSDDADIAFKVKGHIISAHRVILKCFVPDLAELSETCDVANPMPIDDVEPDIFEMMLETVYGSTITSEQWEADSQTLQSILTAAGKYGFSDLKIEAETWYTRSLNLDVGNVIDHLLHADANNLPLVKKAAIRFILQNAAEVVDSEFDSLLDQSPSLLKEVMKAMANKL